MDEDVSTIWDKVDEELPGVVSMTDLWRNTRADQEDVTRSPIRSKKWSRTRLLVIDIVATSLWLYTFVKLFVFDVDRYLLERLPWGDWSSLADYRWLILSLVVVALAMFTRRLRRYALYVAAFPLIFAFWKVPKAARRIRNPNTWVALSHAATTVLSGFRWNLITAVLYVLAFVTIVWADSEPLLAIAATVVFAAMARTFYRVLRLSIGPDRFLRINREGIRQFIGSDRFHNLMRVPDDLTAEEVAKFTSEQQNRFTMNLSLGIAVQRGVLFWAHQLDRYRKSASFYVFGIISFAWLSILTIVSLTLVNHALFKIDPSQFRGAGSSELLRTLLYTINSMNVGNGTQILADGPWALLVSILAGIITWVILGALLLNLAVTYRQARRETSFKEAVHELRAAGASATALLTREYSITVEEAIVRLQTIGGLWMDLIVFFTSRVPDDYLDQETEPQSS